MTERPQSQMNQMHHPIEFAKLAQYDTPTVCNVIELLDIRPRDEGYVDSSVQAIYPESPPIVGYATTAKFQSSKPKKGETGDYGGFIDQVEAFLESVPTPRIVVFEDIDEEPVGATFGEVMCSVYKSFGCAGLITSGGARDVEQVQSLGFPCWASTVIASHAYCRILEIGKPVEIGGCQIESGDIIHADANGITTIPAEHLSTVAKGCGLLVDAENIILHEVRSGTPSIERLRKARQASQDRIAEIAKELRG